MKLKSELIHHGPCWVPNVTVLAEKNVQPDRDLKPGRTLPTELSGRKHLVFPIKLTIPNLDICKKTYNKISNCFIRKRDIRYKHAAIRTFA
jgi:hypothetical protein